VFLCFIGPGREYFAGIFEKPNENREKDAEVTSVSGGHARLLYNSRRC
jgi:hypothetical protein